MAEHKSCYRKAEQHLCQDSNETILLFLSRQMCQDTEKQRCRYRYRVQCQSVQFHAYQDTKLNRMSKSIQLYIKIYNLIYQYKFKMQ